jgi:putative ABC transport system ATP-binding protein
MADDLAVQGLTVEYVSGGYVSRPVNGFDLQAEAGSLVLLLGPSGCGKTTILSCLAGVIRPTAGEVRVGDIDVAQLRGTALTDYRRHRVGIVFQAFNLVSSLTARENVMIPLRGAGTPGSTRNCHCAMGGGSGSVISRVITKSNFFIGRRKSGESFDR